MSFIYRDQPYLIVPQKLPENMLWHIPSSSKKLSGVTKMISYSPCDTLVATALSRCADPKKTALMPLDCSDDV